MARLIFDRVLISDTDGTTNASNIIGIVTDSISMAEELIQVAVEDNQNVTEGFTSTMSFRTRNLSYADGTYSGDAIIATSDPEAPVYAGGSNKLLKKKIRFFNDGAGGADLSISGVYLMGRRVYDNGREEVEVSCQIDSTSTKITSA